MSRNTVFVDYTTAKATTTIKDAVDKAVQIRV